MPEYRQRATDHLAQEHPQDSERFTFLGTLLQLALRAVLEGGKPST